MEKTIKTLVKINKVVNIVALVSSISGAIMHFITGNTSAAIAWTCCSLWIWNVMKTESVLEKTNALLEDLKKNALLEDLKKMK